MALTSRRGLRASQDLAASASRLLPTIKYGARSGLSSPTVVLPFVNLSGEAPGELGAATCSAKSGTNYAHLSFAGRDPKPDRRVLPRCGDQDLIAAPN